MTQIDSCSNSNIITGDCNDVHLNINNNTDNLIISSPDNGSLYINISSNVQFDQNTINSKSNTNNVVIDCNGDCSENIINTININRDLNISCIGNNVNCNSNTIHCPNTCNIDCDDCTDTQIKVNSNNLDNINWKCNTDCTNSSIYNIENNAKLKSWTYCSSEWILLDINDECDIFNTTSLTPTSSDELDRFTILAFVLIGTIIGCLCVIVVTTIICCICWHEHQIKTINMKPEESDKVNHLEPPEHIQRDRTTPSPPGSSTEPSPNSIPRDTLQGPQQPIIGYSPAKSQSPEMGAVVVPHQRKKSATKKPIYQPSPQQANVAYVDDNDDDHNRYNRKMSQNKRKQSGPRHSNNDNNMIIRRGSKKRAKHAQTGSHSVATTNTHNSNISYQAELSHNTKQ